MEINCHGPTLHSEVSPEVNRLTRLAFLLAQLFHRMRSLRVFCLVECVPSSQPLCKHTAPRRSPLCSPILLLCVDTLLRSRHPSSVHTPRLEALIQFSEDGVCTPTSARSPSQFNPGWLKTRVCCGLSHFTLGCLIPGLSSKETGGLRIEHSDPLYG